MKLSCLKGGKLFHLPSRPKLLQKTSLQKSFLEAINFVMITKLICIQLKQTRETPPKHYKNNCFRELFCNNFGQDGTVGAFLLTVKLLFLQSLKALIRRTFPL